MRVRAFFSVGLIWAALTTNASAYVVPHIVLGGQYQATIILSNKTKGFAFGPINKAVINLRTGNAQPWQGQWRLDGVIQNGSSATINIPEKGTRKIVLSGDDAPRTGYLSTDVDGEIMLSFFYTLIDGGRLVDSVGVAPIPVIPLVQNVTARRVQRYSFSVERSATVNTGVAFTNGKTTATPQGTGPILLTLYDEDGAVFRTKAVLNDGYRALFFSELFDDVPANFKGLVQVVPASFESLLFMTVLRVDQEGASAQLTSIPVDSIDSIIGIPIW